MIEYGGEITPAGRARLDKFGSTLDAGNVRVLCERIADYPEVLAAAADALAADDRVIEAATRAVWDHFFDGEQARRYGTKSWPPPEQHMPWWRGIAEAALNATRVLPPVECACEGYAIRTDYGTGVEYDVDKSSCPVHSDTPPAEGREVTP